MDLSRRSFLASSVVTAAAAVALPGAAFSFAAEPARRAPLLVLVHLRGGCDGLNLVCPSLDPALIEARPSDLRVAAEGEGAGFPLGASSGGPSFFLHPQASGLYELHSAGKLAFIHAAGLSAATRSHFVAGDMMDRGVADEGLLLKVQDGWLSRAGRAGDKAPAAGLSASSALAGEFSGLPSSVALSEIGQGGVRPPGGPQSAQALAKMYEGPGKAAAAGRAALAAMSEIDGRLPKSADGKVAPYVPANGADYGWIQATGEGRTFSIRGSAADFHGF